MATPINVIPKFLVNDAAATAGGQEKPQITGLSNGNFLVTWVEDGNGAISGAPGDDIVGKIYDAQGQVVRDAFRVNNAIATNDEFDFSVAATNDGGFIMAYKTQGFPPSSVTAIVWERFDSDGNQTALTQIAAESTVGDALYDPRVVVNLADNSSVVTFEDEIGSDVDARAVAVSSAGVAGAEFDVGENATGGSNEASVAILSNGDYVTLYQRTPDLTNFGVEFQRFSAAGTKIGSAVTVATPASPGAGEPSITALSGGGFVLAWTEDNAGNFDIGISVRNADGTAASTFTLGTNPEIDSQALVRALPDGRFVVLWSSDLGTALFAQAFLADGTADGAQFTVASTGVTEGDIGVTSDGRLLFTFVEAGEIQASVWDPRSSVVTAADYAQDDLTNVLDNTGAVTATSGGTLNGSAAADVLLGAGGAEVVMAGAGNDTIDGGALVDTISGEAGDDRILFSGTDLQDNIDGGADTDTLDASGHTGNKNLRINLKDEMITEATTDAALYARNIENVIGTDFADSITGDDGRNEITGGLGNDLLAGGLGDDTYVYSLGDGQDTITDSGGRDTVTLGASLLVDDMILVVSGDDLLFSVFGSGGDVVTLTNAVNTPGARTDLLAFNDGNVIDLGGIIGGQNFDDTANTYTGSDNSEFHNMRGGDDVVDARAGNDIVVAGAGNDTITGGQGIDQLFGGLGDDVYLYAAGDGVDRIVDTGGRDELRFSAGIDADDLILVVRNADILGSFFGAGSDVFEMINAVTTPSARVDVLRFDDGTALDLGGIVGGQNFDNTANTVTGDAQSFFFNASGGNDTVDAGAGNDIVFGGDGDDSLDGGAGLDVLRGGTGADDFIFSQAPNAADADLILDFQTGSDRILLSSAQFGLSAGALAAGSFFEGTAAGDANDRLIYNAANQQLLFDADGTGAGAAIKIAEISGGVALAESDFLVF